MIGYTKPLYEAEKQIDYNKHIQRLKKITDKKAMSHEARNTIQQMHRIRDKSSHYRTQKALSQINHQNSKLLGKILEISHRRSVQHIVDVQSKIILNPSRKRRQQQIVVENSLLAERLLQKSDQKQKITKAIDEYEKVKRTMKNNKRIQLIPLYEGSKTLDASRNGTASFIRRTEYSEGK